MKRVDLKYLPRDLFVFKDQLWVAGWAKDVYVYNTDLKEIKKITHKPFTCVNRFCLNRGVIVCDGKTGLHRLKPQGDYLKHICLGRFSDASASNDNPFDLEDQKHQLRSKPRDDYPRHICPGRFSDVSASNDTLFALEGQKHRLHILSKHRKGWVEDIELNLSGCGKDCNRDRLCATSTCIYVSCYSNHCVHVYSLSGEFLYKTERSGWGRSLEAGSLHNPFLSDVDSEEKILLCDRGHNRLQVFDPHTSRWAVIQGLEGLEAPWCARVGHKHLWVGTGDSELVKYEAQ